MTARLQGDDPQTPERLAARVRELEELLVSRDHRIDDLTTQLDGARQSVTEQQKADAQHRLVCRVNHRPSSRPVGDVPTQNLT